MASGPPENPTCFSRGSVNLPRMVESRQSGSAASHRFARIPYSLCKTSASQWVQVPKPDAKSTYGIDCGSENGRAPGLAPAARIVTPGCVLAAICPPGGERSATYKRTKVRNVAVRRIALKDWKS